MYIDLEEIQENDFIRENQNTTIDDDYDDGDVVDNKNEDDGGAMSKHLHTQLNNLNPIS